MEEELLLSVIIVTYNAEKVIRSTVVSLLEQTRDFYEIIIIDGKSEDSTLAIIKNTYIELDSKIPITIVSEKDNGIYDAMNKGVIYAKGKYVYFLNAGDLLYGRNVFQQIESHLRENYDVIYGNILDDYGYKRELLKAAELNKIKLKMVFCHQAAFISRQCQIDCLYDVKYKLCADYNFFLSMYLKEKNFLYRDITIAVYSRTGVSSNSTLKVLKEYSEIQKKNGLWGVKQIYVYYMRIVVHYLRQIKYKLIY